jgi:queuine tRNA-ribosyltransferase
MSGPLRFEILAPSRSTLARTGRIATPHGSFDTPAFMPVGTRASIKGVLPDLVEQTGTQIILNNAYHLMLRPGDGLVAQLGGVHAFMRWPGPVLTDSGGYQAFSMSDINRIDDDGVTFRSIVDGSLIRLTPERSMEVQNNLGADIIMAFDDCPPAQECGERVETDEHSNRSMIEPSKPVAIERETAQRLAIANERTARWLERCVASHQRPHEQALFGIVQGGVDLALRSRSVEMICNIDLPGYAIGGVAVGESPELIHSVVRHTAPLLPPEKPRYLMGVGYERDIVEAVRAGIDMFDCVLPTRNGRNANAFTREGRLHLRNSAHREDSQPIDSTCDCAACGGGFSRAYLRHLFLAGEMLGPILVSLHNIRHFQRLMLDIRAAIREDAWSWLAAGWPVLG